MKVYSALKGFYNVEKTIGCGGFAKVKLATHTATGEKVAIKIMEKSGLGVDLPRVKQEIQALKTLCHEHICKLYQVLETPAYYFLVIEYCCGGELFDHIVEKNRLSESQSRSFFREILSAVAYLHSRGYAHRDLKPENVLLNSNKLLKLIDFGLCAKPEGGTNNPLSTSCGSPTYAAPELVMGQQYLGPEVDVWSMGVLLYTLLCGFLPFDDQNIDSLYKKILGGKYSEPTFLSVSSKRVLKSMLQIDPKKRITISQLLSHSWITASGILEPVTYHTENVKQRDDECLAVMAKYHATTTQEMWKNIKAWNYDYNTATYFLLRNRKSRGLSLKLNSTASRSPIPYLDRNLYIKPQTNKVLVLKNENMLQNSPVVFNTPERIHKRPTYCEQPQEINSICETNMKFAVSPQSPYIEPPTVAIRRTLKRIRSFTSESEYSPVPAKKPTTPNKCSSPFTPERANTPLNSENQGSARKVLGSIEKSINKVRHVLRARKHTAVQQLHPTVLTNKDLCNVSTTQCHDPEHVITELSKALRNKGILCERKGYRLRGKLEPNIGKQLSGCSFELEICYLPPSLDLALNTKYQSIFGAASATPMKSALKNGLRNLVHQTTSPTVHKGNESSRVVPTVMLPPVTIGIRRKRLKGDSWCYKKVCEEILALSSIDVKHSIESAV